MPQNGKGVQGGGSLPGNMQHNQPRVMPTSALEGYSATAFRKPFQWESKREVCVKEKEGWGREGGREEGVAKSESESESESERYAHTHRHAHAHTHAYTNTR